ncbi:hypothetical protein GNP61_15145 [Aliivibrio fischeri]|uniref:hypothetical protein n=1 Tax=Aliivibrio fischeri TaxID=668 RepID=UPI0012DA86CB|nr:hypothetical protein [Aliivibrio fischeri]MUK42889.1 hypothetical protein [Aliivibrio fischeri]
MNNEYYVWCEDCQFGLLSATNEYTETIEIKRKLVHPDSKLQYKITLIGDSFLVPDVYYSPRILINQKIYHVLSSLNLPYIQLIPAKIESLHNDFYLLKVINFISLIDENKSKATIKRGNIKNIRRLSLSNELHTIALNDRLIFKVGHSPVTVVHKSIVHLLSILNLKGVTFTPVTAWYS